MAYVGLAEVYYVMPDYAPISNAEAMAQARVAAEKALTIDDRLDEGHAVLGGVHNNLLDWEAAEREYRLALELNPDDVVAHNWYSFFLSETGRFDESIAQIKRAVELEPLNLKYNDNLALMYRNARKFDLALEQNLGDGPELCLRASKSLQHLPDHASVRSLAEDMETAGNC